MSSESEEHNNVILELKGLKKYFPIKRGVFQRTVGNIKAVDGVDLAINRRETVGLVGESGCGKSTLGGSIVKIYDATEGEINYYPQEKINGFQEFDLTEVEGEELMALRKEIQMIFQDPYSSLDPRMSVMDILKEPYKFHGEEKSRTQIREEIEQWMKKVGLRTTHLNRYPHKFSGGQKQRIAVARALCLDPNFLIADEPVSALDVSIQGQIINLLKDLQEEMGLTYLFISHNISLVERISDRIAVMYLGRLMEVAEGEELINNVLHPYTEALLSAVPIADPEVEKERIILPGDPPSPSDPPQGCLFHTRCRYAQKICQEETPALNEVKTDHKAACHFAEELDLQSAAPEAV